ncbi:MAG: hypothetical protein R3C52_10745 [Hyphomonadaceae bacterium]
MCRVLLLATSIGLLSAGLAGCDKPDSAKAHEVAEKAKSELAHASDRLKSLRSGERAKADAPGGGVAIPAWLPKDIWLPDDFQAVQAQKVGGRNYLLNGVSALSTDELVKEYRDRLATAGYEVTPADRTPSGDLVVFEGHGFESCTIYMVENGRGREVRISLVASEP